MCHRFQLFLSGLECRQSWNKCEFSSKFVKAKSATRIRLNRVFSILFHLSVFSIGNVLVIDFVVAFQVYRLSHVPFGLRLYLNNYSFLTTR